MLLQSPKPFTLLIAVILTISVACPFSARVEAKGKKGKHGARSKSSSRSSAKRGKRHSNKRASALLEDNVAAIPDNYPIAPDRIEVIEGGSTSSPDVARYLYLPPPSPQKPQDASDTDPTMRKPLKVDGSRA